MKTKMMIAVLLIGTMIGCSKRTNNKDNAINEPPFEMQAESNAERAIRNNPWDSSGIRHNILLEALRNYQKDTGDTTKAGLKSFFIKEREARTGRVHDIDLDKVDRLFQRVQQVGLAKFLNSETKLNDRIKKYFIRLEELGKEVKSPDMFPSFQIDISSLEQDVLKSDLSQPDQEAVLRVSSIAFHSGLFWKNVYDKNAWLNPSPQPPAMRWWHWPIVIHADLVGGIIGLAMGADIDDAASWMSGGAEGVLNYI